MFALYQFFSTKLARMLLKNPHQTDQSQSIAIISVNYGLCYNSNTLNYNVGVSLYMAEIRGLAKFN